MKNNGNGGNHIIRKESTSVNGMCIVVEIDTIAKTKKDIGIKWFFENHDNDNIPRSKFMTIEEIGEDLFQELKKSIQEEHASDVALQRHTAINLDAATYEGEWFATYDEPYEEEDNKVTFDTKEFLNLLTPTQQRRLEYRLKNPRISYREIAKNEGVCFSKIAKSFQQIKKKLEEFLILKGYKTPFLVQMLSEQE